MIYKNFSYIFGPILDKAFSFNTCVMSSQRTLFTFIPSKSGLQYFWNQASCIILYCKCIGFQLCEVKVEPVFPWISCHKNNLVLNTWHLVEDLGTDLRRTIWLSTYKDFGIAVFWVVPNLSNLAITVVLPVPGEPLIIVALWMLPKHTAPF